MIRVRDSTEASDETDENSSGDSRVTAGRVTALRTDEWTHTGKTADSSDSMAGARGADTGLPMEMDSGRRETADSPAGDTAVSDPEQCEKQRDSPA